MTPTRSAPTLPGSHPTRDAETLAGLIDPFMEQRVRWILQHLSSAGLRLATAESCTGGLLASLFTDVNGVSHVFDRGLVAYDEGVKCDLLGVDRALIDTHGVVSRQVAVAMAEGVIADCPHPTVGVAVTGYAGPGREPGLVHLALARPGGATVHRAQRLGTVGRGAVRLGALRTAIVLLEETL